MTDGFFERLEAQLVAADRRLAPRRRRWRRTIIPATIIAVTAVPALAATRPWEDPYSGPPNSQKLQVQAPVPKSKDVAGVITYRARNGNVCLAAGFVQNGRVGRYNRYRTFDPLDASDAPGQCGDLAQNLIDFGGIALAHGTYANGDPDVPQVIVYGLVRSRMTTVVVTWRDGTRETATITPTDSPEQLQGAEGAYAIAGRPGLQLGGATIELSAPDGTVLHTFEF
jgi:hypothetical protein